MKFREIFRFELVYQLRRVSTWLYFAVVALLAFLIVSANYVHEARRDEFVVNGPFVVGLVTFFCTLVWLLVAASVAGDAAARDVHTGMHPLTYTAPVGKAAYLGGRFLAALVVNALILLAAPAGIVLGIRMSGVEAEFLGPSRPAAYLTAYLFIALPNVLSGTAIQFSLAALNLRVQASYLASFLLFVVAYVAGPVVYMIDRELAHLVDPFGVVGLLSELPDRWTPVEKSTRLIELKGLLLANRLVWGGIALGALAFTYRRFGFGHPAERAIRGAARRPDAYVPEPPRAGTVAAGRPPLPVPEVRRTFGGATHARQALAMAWASFRQIALSRSALVLLAVLTMITVLAVVRGMEHLGVPLFPRTGHVIRILTAPVSDVSTPWIIFPMLTVFFAGELVWRERDAGVGEITGAAPVPQGVLFLSRFLALGLVLVALLALPAAAGIARPGADGDTAASRWGCTWGSSTGCSSPTTSSSPCSRWPCTCW